MAGFFKRLFGGAKEEPPPAEDLGAALVRVHRAYWTRSAAEKDDLVSRAPSLDWREVLRLHHLVCLDLLAAAGNDVEKSLDAAPGANTDLCVKTLERLRSPESPYRPRVAGVFQRGKGADAPRPPDLRGPLSNASFSHLGALEVIRLKDQQPTAVDFVPFDALQAVNLGPPSLYPPARLDYEEPGRTEVVCLPLLYGPSWTTPDESDRNGSMTRFVCHIKGVEGGLGIGHQDFRCDQSLFGLGSVEGIVFPLVLDAPDFEERCRKRGLDPATVRQSANQ
jgi:hypothetical protein